MELRECGWSLQNGLNCGQVVEGVRENCNVNLALVLTCFYTAYERCRLCSEVLPEIYSVKKEAQVAFQLKLVITELVFIKLH